MTLNGLPGRIREPGNAGCTFAPLDEPEMVVFDPFRIEQFRAMGGDYHLHMPRSVVQEIQDGLQGTRVNRGFRLFNGDQCWSGPLENRRQQADRAQRTVRHRDCLEFQTLSLAPFLSEFERQALSVLLHLNTLRVGDDRCENLADALEVGLGLALDFFQHTRRVTSVVP